MFDSEPMKKHNKIDLENKTNVVCSFIPSLLYDYPFIKRLKVYKSSNVEGDEWAIEENLCVCYRIPKISK